MILFGSRFRINKALCANYILFSNGVFYHFLFLVIRNELLKHMSFCRSIFYFFKPTGPKCQRKDIQEHLENIRLNRT